VIADLYLSEEACLDAEGLAGLERVARFGEKASLTDGWRAWLARGAGRAELAAAAPAAVAALCTPASAAGFVWLATPVHLVTDLTSLHLQQRGLLRLPPTTLRVLAEDFARVFHGSGFKLEPLPSGGFLVGAPAASAADTLEPARLIGMDIGAALPASAALRRLGAELEIWLHEHPVNLGRIERGELPVSTLWVWGGGIAAHLPAAALPTALPLDRSYGSDPYLDGLACASGARTRKLPERIADLLQAPARRIVIVVDLAEHLEAHHALGAAAALAALDARWILPATRLVARGAVRTLRVVANNRCLSFMRRDRLRLWRPSCRGLRGIS
jgi:hypothetical protein